MAIYFKIQQAVQTVGWARVNQMKKMSADAHGKDFIEN